MLPRAPAAPPTELSIGLLLLDKGFSDLPEQDLCLLASELQSFGLAIPSCCFPWTPHLPAHSYLSNGEGGDLSAGV